MSSKSQQMFQSDFQSPYLPQEELSEGFDSCEIKSPKKYKRSNNAKKKGAHLRKSSKGYFWPLPENIKYKEFVQQNLQTFKKPLKQRKALKIHVLMSQYIGTRNSSQCRSHHQKMLASHGSLPSIIEFIETMQSKRKINDEEEADVKNANSSEMKMLSQKAVRPDYEDEQIWDCLVKDRVQRSDQKIMK